MAGYEIEPGTGKIIVKTAAAATAPVTSSSSGRRAMRVRLRGINSVKKRLADGHVVTYRYA